MARCTLIASAGLFLVAALLGARADLVPVQAGAAVGNAFVGGRTFMWVGQVNYTNCCAGGTLTNLGTYPLPRNALTNGGDAITVFASGKFSTTGQSKRLVLTYGSQDLLDSGLQAVSNGTWIIQATVVRLGTLQYYVANLMWDRGVIGGGTNSSGWVSQTNGINTTIRLQGAANVVSCITNECFLVDWTPGPQ